MFNKLNDLSVKAYVKATNAVTNAKTKIKNEVKSFTEDERGVDGIIIAVLLLLVAVVLVAVFWEYISEWFGNLWDSIFNSAPDVSKDGAKGDVAVPGGN
ncbi:MAG: hypothetical protein J6K17_13330 [Oscillospiraceae bacterium]|nr:hypothetical protein [Oscillospiraceae bacterium]